ncbi:MAG: YfhO family protein [Lachnospiraceae bacterium]|nr:YfhO family protein [Lachnospiraceae bacterium]
MKKETGKQILLYTILFSLCGILGYAGLWQNGRTYVWYRDGADQYLPGLLYVGQYLRELLEGILSGRPVLPMYDLSIAFGEDIIGSMNYYGLGEPLNLLAVFANKGNGTVWYTLLFFVRLYLGGISFLCYANYMRLDRRLSVFGALMFVFSGFPVYGGGMYAAWVTVLIYFPLLLLGAEMVFHRDSRAMPVMSLSVAYGALCGFYYLYMCGISLAVYCLVRLYFIHGLKWKEILDGCLKCLWPFLLGLGLSAPILLPSLLIVGNSDRTGFPIYYVVFNYHNYIPRVNEELMASLLHPRDSQMSYLGGLTLLEILGFFGVFFLKKGRRKNQLLLLFAVVLISLHFPIITCLFNAFADTYNRWVFLIHFSLGVIFAAVFEEGLGMLCRKAGSAGKGFLAKGIWILTALAVCGNIILNLSWLFSKPGTDWEKEFLPLKTVEAYIDSPVNASRVIRSDPALFRISKENTMVLNERPENTAMLNGYHGTVYWISMINGYVQRYARAIDEENDRWRCYGLGRDSVFETASGVKYHLTKHPENVPGSYELKETLEYDGEAWQVFENPDFVGMAYLREPPKGEPLLEDGTADREYYAGVLQEGREKSAGEASDIRMETNGFRFHAEAKKDCEAFIVLGFSPGWKAYVDGQEASLQEADLMGMKLDLPRGSHEVVLRYHTPGLSAGLVVFLASLMLFISWKKIRLHCIIRKKKTS